MLQDVWVQWETGQVHEMRAVKWAISGLESVSTEAEKDKYCIPCFVLRLFCRHQLFVTVEEKSDYSTADHSAQMNLGLVK